MATRLFEHNGTSYVVTRFPDPRGEALQVQHPLFGWPDAWVTANENGNFNVRIEPRIDEVIGSSWTCATPEEAIKKAASLLAGRREGLFKLADASKALLKHYLDLPGKMPDEEAL